jgi:hypothetical protein
VILEIIFPALGGVFGLLMFLSPIKAVLRARKERSLGVSTFCIVLSSLYVSK